ncbi:hypothetical protein VPH49_21760 [Pseudomonas luteola]|uniref:hypothetical protein n=1 Tax=Pseudomonas luteola TaxID=47886 RepID=UPI003A86C719
MIPAHQREPDTEGYVNGGGIRCPFCKSESTEGGDNPEFDGGFVTAESHCLECGAEWVDTFSLVGVEISKRPEGLMA